MTSVSGRTPGRNAAGMWRVPRSRGAVNGVVLVLLGVWAGLVPFWGPQFGYAYTPATTWTFTYGRLWLEILPATAVILGGLGMLTSANRPTALTSSWLAAVAGAWFVVGPSLSLLWTGGPRAAGDPAAVDVVGRSVTEIGFFYGLGAAVLLLAAIAIGRFSVVGVRESHRHHDTHESAVTREEPPPEL